MQYRNTFLLVIIFILGIFTGYIFKTFSVYMENNSKDIGKSSRRLITVDIDIDQQKELFNAMQRFADQNGFAFRIAPLKPDGLTFGIDMWRRDIHIEAINGFSVDSFDVAFFETDSAFYPLPDWVVNSVVKDFKLSLEAVPTIVISDR
ncbi:MAG: hypothetical protein H7Y59_00015 [Anaerolineales bacterium]|nr:hypothetical protein [Anaerolineales bacterium]